MHEDTANGYRPLGLATLLRRAVTGQDLTQLGSELVEYTRRSDDAGAWLDLSLVLQMRYDKPAAMAAQAQALGMQALYRVQDAADPQHATRVLALKAPGDLMANTPFECLCADRALQIDALYVGEGVAMPESLPEHDVLLVAACASEANAPTLERIAALAARATVPVLNRPDGVVLTERGAAYALLGEAPGIAMAATVRCAREVLQRAAAGDPDASQALPPFPLIVRPVGSHAGQGLVRVLDAEELARHLDAAAGVDDFYVAAFIDYRSGDGLYRKYRIVLIDGQPFLCHMGISADWMVHYPYPEMAAHPERREEEARAMAGFDDDFAARHAGAFAEVAARTGLDYVGFDCAETRDGQLLIFEIATGMVVHDMDDAELFPYKAPQLQRVFAAFRAMLHRAAGSAS